MRKLLTVVLTLALLIGASLSTGYADDVRKFEGTVLHMIAEQQTPTVALMKQLDAFEELTGIRVELEMGPFDNVVQKITLAMYSGSDMYDIIATPYQFLGNLVVNGYVQPLEPLMQNPDLRIIPGYNEDDIIAGMWQASGEWKGTIYGIPANSCIMHLAYRQDLFDNPEEQAKFKGKYGYDLVVPTDWDTYRDVAEFFTRSAGETLAGEKLTHNFYGVSMSGKRHDATTCEWLNYAWSFGGGVFDDEGNIIIGNEKNIAALEYYKELAEFAPPGVTNKTWDEQTTEMQQGIAAMAIIFNDCLPAIEDPQESTVAGKMGYGAIPIGEAPAAHYGAWTYFIPTASRNPEAAWVFLQWFNTPEVQKNLALDGAFPNLVSVYNDPDLRALPYWAATEAAYEISTTRPRIPEWNEMNEVLMLHISNVLSGQSDPATALDAVQKEYERILAGQLPIDYQ
jgi:multiple sugar transport system substrate-binding protein